MALFPVSLLNKFGSLCLSHLLAAVLLVGFLPSTACAEAATPIRIDASAPAAEPSPAAYDGGSVTSPTEGTLGINSRYLTLNGKPWLPSMGEFHFSRYPRDQWENEILKMKAAGVNIVAAYVIWIHHEEIEGQSDWTGQRDLRAFAQICAKHHMYLIARIGPWDHAEVRNGGFPDWVVKQGPTRVNDPAYLASVKEWFGQIGGELQGLLWKDGGPVLGIQLENEYSQQGPNAGEAHILALKKIAIDSGLDVPLYLVTAWDNAVVPPGAVLPVYGGKYPDAPWDSSTTQLQPADVYAFRFQSRVSADLVSGTAGGQSAGTENTPYLTAEIGGGIEDTYHRRPVIQADDIGAMFPVMLGSGVNLYGTYMFQGGENPDGKLTTLQESQATGYANDVPIKSYDFQAPLGEFGQERESLRKLKVFQYFLNTFGSELAPMVAHAPDALPSSAADLKVPRASVRSLGERGFIFFNNYVRGYAMPARPGTQFLVRLPGGTLSVPNEPVDLPSGAYFIWPFNFRAGDITIRYSTAQLFTRLDAGAKNGPATFYFEAIHGIPVEFAFDASSIQSVHASSGAQLTKSGVLYLDGIKPGIESSIELTSRSGSTVRLVVLTAQEAENAWKVRVGGGEHLLISAQDFFSDPDAPSGRIWLRSRANPHFEFVLTPPLTSLFQASLPLKRTGATENTTQFAADAGTQEIGLEFKQIKTAGSAPPITLGPALSWRPIGVAQAPAEQEPPQAARWSITVPPAAMSGLSELFLEVDYRGDVARLYGATRLLDDNFFNGQPWSIGLGRFLNQQNPRTFELSILPMRSDAPVYLELGRKLTFSANGQVATLEGLRLVPEYELLLCDHGACPSSKSTAELQLTSKNLDDHATKD
jgi:hypothetical protein